jgi:DNA-binding MarR family transcriptional regulator
MSVLRLRQAQLVWGLFHLGGDAKRFASTELDSTTCPAASCPYFSSAVIHECGVLRKSLSHPGREMRPGGVGLDKTDSSLYHSCMNQTRSGAEQSSLLLESIARADRMLAARIDSALDANGLSRAKLGVLKVLVEAGEPLPLGQLAERLTCVKSNITQLIDRLEADGLVQRVPDAHDRRSKRAAIRDEGRRRYEIGMQVKGEVEQEMLQVLSADEQGQLVAVLEKLGSVGEA